MRLLNSMAALPYLLLCWLVFAADAQCSDPDPLDPRLETAIALYRTAGAEAALPEFERLLEQFRVENRTREVTSTTRFLGELHWRVGEFGESANYLDDAIELARSTADSREEAKSLNVLGLLEWDRGRFDMALEAFELAFSIANDLGDQRIQASIMNNRALVLDELGRYEESLQNYKKALELFEADGNLRGQGDSLGNIGGVYLLAGRFREASAYYQRALDISTELESKASMTIDNGNLGLAHTGLGNYETALAYFDSALSLARETGMRIEEAYWHRGRADSLKAQGRYDDALREFRVALESARDAGAPALEMDTLSDQGNLYLELGDIASASESFDKAADLAGALGMPQGVTANLVSLGDARMAMNQAEMARTHYQSAAQRANQAGEPGFESLALARLARVELETGHAQAAFTLAHQAVSLALEIGASGIEAEAWLVIAGAARIQQDLERAAEAFSKAEEAAGSSPELAWQIHHGRAGLLEEKGEKERAIDELKRAISVIEGVRAGLAGKRFRSGWMQDKYQVYVDLVRLQLGMSRDQQAFMSAERLRAQAYIGLMGSGGFSARSEAQKRVETDLRVRITHLTEALSKEQSQGKSGQRQAAIDFFSSELVAAERQYLAFLDDLGYNPVESPITNLPSLAEIQASLQPEEALIEYLVATDGLVIFLLKNDAVLTYVTESGHADLVSRIRLLRGLVTQVGNADWISPASRLSTILLGSVVSTDMLAEIEHLIVVPHGILNYIPFALLPLPGQQNRLLVEQFTISYLPSAAARVRGVQRKDLKPSILAMAPQISRLEYAPGEARSVASVFRTGATVLEGEAATESAFKSQAPDYRVIHLATHGVFNTANPMLSALELEADELNDGMLEVHEILGLSLQAELVTLSACQTAMGSGWFNPFPAGDEFVGLSRAFMQAGSESILASLWEVDDRSTVSFMEGFYRGFGQGGEGLRKAAALAEIQRELRLSENYSHPFYWAPFVLMGGERTGGARL